MSRLIVQNLPTYATPVHLRKHFEQKGGPGGTITDVKVALKQDGTSRRFGFVGFKTEKEALAARDWFDRTFIDSTRITVTISDGAKDAPAPRPNKRPRLGPSPAEQSTPVAVSHPSDATQASAPDTQLDEFLEVMRPRGNKGRSWANDVGQPIAGPSKATNDNPTISEPAVEEASDDVPMGDANGGGQELSDAEWMRRHMSKKVDTPAAFEQDEEVMRDPPSKASKEALPSVAPQDSNRETILQTSRLFLRNLAYSCTESDLQEVLHPFGEISQIHIPLDPKTKQPKGVAYATFAKPTDALAAYEALDKKSFQGRLLHILAAVDRKGKVEVEDGEGRKRTVKEEKHKKRQDMAGKEFNWSMLYMNSDAVASSIADRLNISKSDILNPESDNAAVKLALAETHVIQETKTYFEEQGVVLSSFTSRARSDTTILVKNIPYGTTAEQIRELFEPHGTLSRVLVPPAGTMAVVDFDHADEAARAFKAVAYRRLGNSIIYLEKGPFGMFSEPPDADSAESHTANKPSTSSAVPPVTIREQQESSEEAPSLAAGTTLFVKNLSFATTAERLTQAFRALPGFAFARVQTKPNPKNPDGPRLSMGYGFVGFKDVEAAQAALKSMQASVLDGHALHVKFAGRGQEDQKDEPGKSSKSRTTKMIVKNVPFEATKKDIRALFSAHGQLKSVRLPKKFDSRSRGFAFLDFVSRHEAENAFAALKHTHLLGRHLVLQWAEEGEQDIEALRQKAGVGFGGGKDMPGRKRKLDMGGDKEADVEDMEV
ncbi:hypothetical protein HGRIS_007110 [Hohenbuehelia grisea]|uniref:Multiple RNA-binding domain-containing protein 1 n=1 Tax=Hohenbuehelia grisea TaxID=104357 RepID=A0ABR3JB20_9AGAR